MLVLFLLNLLLGFLLYRKIVVPFLYWKQRDIFYVTPWSRLYKLFLSKDSFADMVKAAYNDFPDHRYYGSYQFLQPSLLVRDLDLAKQITTKDFEYFTDHMELISEKTDPILGLNLFSLKGQKWRAMRSTLSPAFTSSKMRAMFNLISETAETVSDHFLKKTDDVTVLEMKDLYTKYTNDVIANCAFGVKINSLQNPKNDFYSMGQFFVSTSIWRLFLNLCFAFFPKIFQLFKISMFPARISRFFQKLIKETIAVREKNQIVRPDLIHLLTEARKGKLHRDKIETVDTGFATVQESEAETPTLEITDDVITAQALVFFIAGFTTSSALLSFLSYELAVNPEIQVKLQKEIDETLVKSQGKIGYEELLKMKYLDQVVSEALRKWPPGYVLNRVCVKDYTIQPVKPHEKPALISKGCLVAIPAIAIHYCEEFFPNPDHFDPERFSDENRGKIVPGSYMPFGLGPRNCIGSRFALLEIKALVVNLLAKFELTPVRETRIPLQLSKRLALEAQGGVWLGLKRRLK